MKLIGKLIGTVFALVVTIFMVQGIASETGEVVVLTTVEQAVIQPQRGYGWWSMTIRCGCVAVLSRVGHNGPCRKTFRYS